LLGSIVFPGAGYIAMIIAASGSTQNVVLEDITFKSALVIPDKETSKKTQVALNSTPSKFPTSVSISLSFC
jgi:Polyketide synthase dehydratase